MGDEIYGYMGLLADPTRVRLLCVLEREELTVSELTRVLGIPQSTASRHLKALRIGGWLDVRSAGTNHLFRAALCGLPEVAGSLWDVVRSGVEGTPQHIEDLERLEQVVSARRLDSRTFFGRIAADWDRVRRELFGDGFTLPALLALLDPGLVVADLGCGTGAAAEQLARAVSRVVAVDREDAMLETARLRLEGIGNVELRKGELTALPLATGEVDAAVCLLVLHHVEDVPAALREIARALRPGGRLVILDMQKHDREHYRQTMGHAHLGFTVGELRAAARDTGLDLARLQAMPAAPDAGGPPVFVAAFERVGGGASPRAGIRQPRARRPRAAGE